jgi:TonB family protein
MIPQRKKRNSSKINLIISVVFHTGLILGVGFLAAREGMLGTTLKQITVTMAPKEKKLEPPKEKPAEPKIAAAKAAEEPKAVAVAPPARAESAPPPSDSAPIAAPEAVVVSDMDFSDGAKDVRSADPNGIYKGLIERTIHARWNRPEDLDDEKFVAEVEISVDQTGRLSDYRWKSGSGNARWDDSVKAALAATKMVGSKPPKGFPGQFTIRFDVESMRSEPVMQLSSR